MLLQPHLEPSAANTSLRTESDMVSLPARTISIRVRFRLLACTAREVRGGEGGVKLLASTARGVKGWVG